jgi:hypothetical protein
MEAEVDEGVLSTFLNKVVEDACKRRGLASSTTRDQERDDGCHPASERRWTQRSQVVHMVTEGVEVTMRIDETRHDQLVGGVDNPFGIGRGARRYQVEHSAIGE